MSAENQAEVPLFGNLTEKFLIFNNSRLVVHQQDAEGFCKQADCFLFRKTEKENLHNDEKRSGLLFHRHHGCRDRSVSPLLLKKEAAAAFPNSDCTGQIPAGLRGR